MNHLKSFNKLNRNRAQRKALYKSMSVSLFKYGRIKTTITKAKEIRRIGEKLITRAKVKSLHNIRQVSRVINDKTVLMKLFNEIAPLFIERKGGYTRIIKLGRRKGDGADLAYLELIQGVQASRKKKKKIVSEKENKIEEKEPKEKKEEIKKENKQEEKKAKEKDTTKVDLKEEVEAEKRNLKDKDLKEDEKVKIKKGKTEVEKKDKKKRK
jgi:large subunit ribosomal protein L17